MAKKNTNKKSDVVKVNYTNKTSVKEDFNKSINKSKGFSKEEYLEKSFNLRVDQFNHKKEMDYKNFGLKANNAVEDRNLSKYKIDQQVSLAKWAKKQDLAFREKKLNAQMSMNIQNEAAKMVEAKKRAKKDALKTVWHGLFGHRF